MRERLTGAAGPITRSREQGQLRGDGGGAFTVEVMDTDHPGSPTSGPLDTIEPSLGASGGGNSNRVLVSEPLQRNLEAARKSCFFFILKKRPE